MGTCIKSTCDHGFYYDIVSDSCKTDPCPQERGDTYHFDPDLEECTVNVCNCKNGATHDNGMCLVHGGEECVSCNTGFRHDPENIDRCQMNKGSFFYNQLPCFTPPYC